MSTYIAVIFETEKKAGAGLHKLWQMDTEGALTVHGASIVRRDDLGDVQVSHKHTDAAKSIRDRGVHVAGDHARADRGVRTKIAATEISHGRGCDIVFRHLSLYSCWA